MASPLPVSPINSPKPPADPNKSPSEQYAMIDTGVYVPLMYDSSGKFLSHMMPLKSTPTTSQPAKFGQSGIPQSKFFPSSCPQTNFGFAFKPWAQVKREEFGNNTRVSIPPIESPAFQLPTTQQLHTKPVPSTPLNTKPLLDQAPLSQPGGPQVEFTQIASGQLPLTGSPHQSITDPSPPHTQPPSEPNKCCSDGFVGHDNFKTLKKEPENIETKLLQNKEFLADIGKRLMEDKRFIHKVASKIEQGGFTSGSLTQRHHAACQPLISLCTSNGLPEPHIRSTCIVDEHDVIEFEVEIKLGMQGKSIFRSSKCKTLEDALAGAQEEALQMLEDLGLKTVTASSRGQTLGSVEYALNKESHMQTRHCTPNRKRQVGKTAPDPQDFPDVNTTSLMARLYNVALTDGEARISVICDYLDTNEPTLEKIGSGNGVFYRAHFKDTKLGHVNAEGSSIAIVYRKLEQKLLCHLEVVKQAQLAEDHAVNKRRRCGPSNRPGYIALTGDDSDDGEDDSPEKLFVLDTTGDERLAVSKACKSEG